MLLCEISPAVSQERRNGGAEDGNLTNPVNILRLQSNALWQTLLWLGGLSNEPRCPDFANSQERQQKAQIQQMRSFRVGSKLQGTEPKESSREWLPAWAWVGRSH